MALVTWKCGHQSRVIGTEKGKANYMVCRDCYTKQQAAPKVETAQQKAELNANIEAELAKSEIQNY